MNHDFEKTEMMREGGEKTKQIKKRRYHLINMVREYNAAAALPPLRCPRRPAGGAHGPAAAASACAAPRAAGNTRVYMDMDFYRFLWKMCLQHLPNAAATGIGNGCFY